MVVFYTTGCPKCGVLKKKLDAKGIEYQIVDSPERMLDLGITRVPVLKVENKLLEFAEANNWINQQ